MQFRAILYEINSWIYLSRDEASEIVGVDKAMLNRNKE